MSRYTTVTLILFYKYCFGRKQIPQKLVYQYYLFSDVYIYMYFLNMRDELRMIETHVTI